VDDDDLRARLLVAQQTIDRMLTETAAPAGGVVMAAAAEGGRGAGANGATVSVERARLIQLRQQLDAVLAKLGRR
jgi:hypothetical protein